MRITKTINSRQILGFWARLGGPTSLPSMTFMMIAMIMMMEMTKIYEVNGDDEVRFMNIMNTLLGNKSDRLSIMRRRWALNKGSGFLLSRKK